MCNTLLHRMFRFSLLLLLRPYTIAHVPPCLATTINLIYVVVCQHLTCRSPLYMLHDKCLDRVETAVFIDYMYFLPTAAFPVVDQSVGGEILSDSFVVVCSCCSV
jgi:hypothetical protein